MDVLDRVLWVFDISGLHGRDGFNVTLFPLIFLSILYAAEG